MPQHRNPIKKLGSKPRGNYTPIANDIIRKEPHSKKLGTDGFAVLAYMMSEADGWETSPAKISEEFGWGANRRRATAALARLTDDDRLVIREHVRDGHHVAWQYVLRADGGRLSEDERREYSLPLVLKPKGTDLAQGDDQ